MQHEEHMMRQAAVFGIGPAAGNTGNAFVPIIPQALEALAAVVNDAQARQTKERRLVTENAISSFGRILKHV